MHDAAPVHLSRPPGEFPNTTVESHLSELRRVRNEIFVNA